MLLPMLLSFVFSLFAVTANVAYKYASCSEDPACRKTSSYSETMTEVMRLIRRDHLKCKSLGECPTIVPSITASLTPCLSGKAGDYDCSGVDMYSFVSLTDMTGTGSVVGDGNDIWGWTDPSNGDMYAIAGTSRGTAFVRVTNPLSPVVVAWMPSYVTTNTLWRDMKVYGNYVYIVADRSKQEIQYYNMEGLRQYQSVTNIEPDGIFVINKDDGNGNTHNIVMNTDIGMAYAVGCSNCEGGLYMIDVTNGIPEYAGCFNEDGYIHDAQCVTYYGPHTKYNGKNICFGYNEDTLTIIDVTIPSEAYIISRTTYTGAAYTHQGWVTDDQRFLFLDDELDENRGTDGNTGYARTYLWDISDLENPINSVGGTLSARYFQQSVIGIDHNLYVKGNYVYQANYETGLRILEYTVTNGQLSVTEVAYFDTYPSGDSVSFNGAWSIYIFFDSDFIVLQDINRGLFVLKPTVLDAEKRKSKVEYYKSKALNVMW